MKQISEKSNKQREALNYLWLAFNVFGGLGLEVVILMIELFIYSGNSNDWGMVRWILHWTITCIVWAGVARGTAQFAKKKYNFDIMNHRKKPELVMHVFPICATIIWTVIQYISWDGIKIIVEFNKKGFVAFTFQHIYYIFEMMLTTIIIVFGQKFGEVLTKKTIIPWGGIVLAITWGMVHMLSQNFETGIQTIFMSITFGVIYIFMKKNIFWTYLYLLLIFIL